MPSYVVPAGTYAGQVTMAGVRTQPSFWVSLNLPPVKGAEVPPSRSFAPLLPVKKIRVSFSIP